MNSFPDNNKIHFIRGKRHPAKSFADLYNPDLIAIDDSQRVLLPWINQTHLLLENAMRQYDNSATVCIIPSLDLGFTYNIARLSGGFTTGMYLRWNCCVPFIPIDATLNICTSSIFELSGISNLDCFSEKRVSSVLAKMRKQGYHFDFHSGNHFIVGASNLSGKYFLLLHSSDGNYKSPNFGTSPSDSSWFIKDVNQLVDDSGRYINYLIGDTAEKWIGFAQIHRHENKLFHYALASEIAKDCCMVKSIQSKSHYDMPSSNSIIIGSFLLQRSEVVPIFSNKGIPIILYSPSDEMWSFSINNDRFYLIPHGWGQEIKGIRSIICKEDKNIIIEIDSSFRAFEVSYSGRFAKNFVQVRDYPFTESGITANADEYLHSLFNGLLHGSITDILMPHFQYP